MVLFLISSVASFLALFFALLVLLRRAAAQGRSAVLTQPAASAPSHPVADLPTEPYAPVSHPLLPPKRPDWRFLVRSSQRSRSRWLRSSMRPNTPPATPPDVPQGSPVLAGDGTIRSDWAYFNEDLGDLKDPYQQPLPLIRRA